MRRIKRVEKKVIFHEFFIAFRKSFIYKSIHLQSFLDILIGKTWTLRKKIGMWDSVTKPIGKFARIENFTVKKRFRFIPIGSNIVSKVV